MEKNSVDEILERLPDRLRFPLNQCRQILSDRGSEVALRADRPLCIYCGKTVFYLTNSGYLTDSPYADDLLITTPKELENTVLRLCDYSLYAFGHEINSGYITIGSGVRVGICGRAVMQNGSIRNIRDIGTVSFRISREVIGCSQPLLKKIDPLKGVLICGEPGSGKTTLIRDLSRSLSYHYRVSLLDERCELSAYCRGKSGFDTGLCDVYIGYQKGDAAISAVRSMSPDIIICDELGDQNDVAMLQYALRCGVAFIASIHAADPDDLRSRKITREILATGAFCYAVFLSGKGQVGTIVQITELNHADV